MGKPSRLRLRVRPHKPIPLLDPILIPIPADASIDLDYLSRKLSDALACDDPSNLPGGAYSQLCIYLDGYKLTGRDTKVHDVLREGDVVDVYLSSHLPPLEEMPKPRRERQSSSSRVGAGKRKRRSSFSDSDEGSCSSSQVSSSSSARLRSNARHRSRSIKRSRARSTRSPAEFGPDSTTIADSASQISPPVQGQDIQAEAERIALMIKSEIGSSHSDRGATHKSKRTQSDDHDSADRLPSPPPGLGFGNMPTFASASSSHAGPSTLRAMPAPPFGLQSASVGAAAAMAAFDRKKLEAKRSDGLLGGAKANATRAPQHQHAVVSPSGASPGSKGKQRLQQGDYEGSSDSDSSDPSASSSSGSSASPVSAAASRLSSSQSDSGSDSDSDSSSSSGSSPAMERSKARSLSPPSSTDSDTSSEASTSASDSSSRTGSDSSDSEPSVQTTRPKALPFATGKMNGPPTPPGGWVPPGYGMAKTKAKNVKKRAKRRAAQAEQRDQDFLSARERAARRAAGEEVDVVAVVPPAAPTSSPSDSDESSGESSSDSSESEKESPVAWAIDTKPTEPLVPHSPTLRPVPPVSALPQLSVKQSLAKREKELAELRAKIRRLEESKKVLPPGGGILDIDFSTQPTASPEAVKPKSPETVPTTNTTALPQSSRSLSASSGFTPVFTAPLAVPKLVVPVAQAAKSKSPKDAKTQPAKAVIDGATNTSVEAKPKDKPAAHLPAPSTLPGSTVPKSVILSSVDCEAWYNGAGVEEYLYVPEGQASLEAYDLPHQDGPVAQSKSLAKTSSSKTTGLPQDQLAQGSGEEDAEDDETRAYLAMRRKIREDLRREKEREEEEYRQSAMASAAAGLDAHMSAADLAATLPLEFGTAKAHAKQLGAFRTSNATKPHAPPAVKKKPIPFVPRTGDTSTSAGKVKPSADVSELDYGEPEETAVASSRTVPSGATLRSKYPIASICETDEVASPPAAPTRSTLAASDGSPSAQHLLRPSTSSGNAREEDATIGQGILSRRSETALSSSEGADNQGSRQSRDGSASSSSSASRRKDKQSTDYVIRSGVAGGVAGCVAKTVIAPLDRVKILFQAQNPEFQKYSGHWLGVFRAAREIVTESGPMALFRGHSATLARIFPYAAIKYMAYDKLHFLLMPNRQSETSGRLFLAGASSGVLSVFMTYPLELIRVRLAFETKKRKIERGALRRIIHQIYTEGSTEAPFSGDARRRAARGPVDGVVSGTAGATQPAAKSALPSSAPSVQPTASNLSASVAQSRALAAGATAATPVPPSHPSMTVHTTNTLLQRFPAMKFYRGFSVTVLGMVPYAGTSFLVFGRCKRGMQNFFGVDGAEGSGIARAALHTAWVPSKTTIDLTSGALAGAISQTAAYPFEVVRRRQQVAAVFRPGAMVGMGETMLWIWKTSGWRGFYTGLSIGFLKVVPMTSVSFAVWMGMKRQMGI